MEQHRVIGHVVAVHGFRLKVEISSDAKSSSRATLDGVQRAVAINSFLTFDLGAGAYALGNLTDLEARESYDPSQDEELSLELTKPRRIAAVQLLGTVRCAQNGEWKFDTGITVLPTLDTPVEVANPDILAGVFGNPPQRNQPKDWLDRADDPYDYPLELGHQTGDENTKVKASFNDLFSRPLAVVGNTGSGKSYTVASLVRGIIENEHIQQNGDNDPHVFVLDINGEYANAFLSEEEKGYAKDPNEAYVNGRKFSVPAWLMNAEEVCEWLSAAEQTQQPVLKAWWAFLKAQAAAPGEEGGYLDEALASVRQMYPLSELKKNGARDHYLAIVSFLSEENVDLAEFEAAVNAYLVQDGREPSGYKNFYGDPVTNPKEIDEALKGLIAQIDEKLDQVVAADLPVASGDTPAYIPSAKLRDSGNLVTASAKEDAPKIDQHLTTLRMRLKTRLADKRWSVFTNYDALGIDSTAKWFESLGFAGDSGRVTVLDLSMLAHEVLPSFALRLVGSC